MPRTRTVAAARTWASVAIVVALAVVGSAGSAGAQSDAEDLAGTALAAMTPTQRVGQLFVVPFQGATVEDDSPIARLVDTFHIGGVVLDPGNGNFANGPDAPTQVAGLANELQRRASAAGAPFAPLFIALTQLGNGYPHTQLHGGMTPLPSQMAIGASWRPEHAARVGEIVGEELAVVGVNLLLGPSLDVVDVPRPDSSGDLGEQSYGGSPPWVARFGRQYIAGVHRGSGGRVATAAGSFPGIGSADRSPAEEGAVVDKTMPELQAVELLPFAAVAEGGSRPDAATDAFVSSHLRYRGIQQQADRPFSLDRAGLRYVWAQVSPLLAWRQNGGVLVSPGLGLPAVRQYVDPEGDAFNVRRVVGEALAAGNDVLLATELGPPTAPTDGARNIEDAISWLASRYEEDETVREAVDDAALRVLRLKYDMYGRAALSTSRVRPGTASANVGVGGEAVSAVARDALTLVKPTATDGGSDSPVPGDRIALVVDARDVRECDACEAYLAPDPAGMVDTLLRVYGPDGTARIESAEDVSAVTYRDLKAWLQASGSIGPEDTPALVADLSPERLAEIEARLAGAEWIVFAMRDVRPLEAPGSDALKLFLKVSPAATSDARLVAIALGAPYYLDTTEIDKLALYLAVYAHTEPFVDVALRALFGDEAPGGASPVSIPGAGYELGRRLEPDPAQTVSLELVGRGLTAPIAEGEPLTVRTSVVRDLNGNTAPDGTLVTFRRYDRAEDVFLPDVPSATTIGRATSEMRAERGGELVITAVFANGLRSEPLTLDIEPSPDAAADSLVLPDVPLPAVIARPAVPVDWGILTLSLTLILLAAVLFYGVDAYEPDAITPVRRARLFLLILAWGLAGYLLVAAGGLQMSALPGGARLWPRTWNEAFQAPLLAFAFALVPVVPSLWRGARAQLRR